MSIIASLHSAADVLNALNTAEQTWWLHTVTSFRKLSTHIPSYAWMSGAGPSFQNYCFTNWVSI